jgi:hypothetical protein
LLILSVALWVCLKPIKRLIIRDILRREQFNKQAAEHALQIHPYGVEQIVISTAIYCKPCENIEKRISTENTTLEQLESSAKVIKILRSASFESDYHGTPRLPHEALRKLGN